MAPDEKMAKQMAFVEEVGMAFEQSNAPRMAGRIIGWLLICEPEHQTSAQIAKVLKASKGSISTMTRFLTNGGIIEKVGEIQSIVLAVVNKTAAIWNMEVNAKAF